MKLYGILALLLACPAVYCQSVPQPLTQVEACRKFTASIVQVDSDTMRGTGFVADQDGWIVTALHVVANPKTLTKYGKISVTVLGYARPFPAEIMSPIDDLARSRDFVVLKIDKTKLSHLDMGTEIDVENGSPIAIIGLPFSAPISGITPRFCLAGTVAAQTSFGLGNLRYLHTIYFQGVSIKGISGAPIISLVTGKVIGIVSTKLTGIGQALDLTRQRLSSENGSLQIGGFSTVSTTQAIIDVLDTQLANGLGSGTGASDAVYALEKAKSDYQPHLQK